MFHTPTHLALIRVPAFDWTCFNALRMMMKRVMHASESMNQQNAYLVNNVTALMGMCGAVRCARLVIVASFHCSVANRDASTFKRLSRSKQK